MKKTLEELVNTKDSAWPIVQEWVSSSPRSVEVLPPADDAGEALVAVQVTTRSPMGSVVFHSGGLLLDHAWLRVLGSGGPKLTRSLPKWNSECGLLGSGDQSPYLLVADDAVGGFFAINGGGFSPQPGTIWYFAPDTLKWENLNISYSDFLRWCLTGNIEKFYSLSRWEGWEVEVSALPGDKAFNIYPPLSTEGPDIGQRSRKVVPISEIYSLYVSERR